MVIVRREILLYNDYGNLFFEKWMRKVHKNLLLDVDDDDKPDKNKLLGRCLGLAPVAAAGDAILARSPVVSLSFSFSLSFARSRLILFLKNPFFSFSCPPPILLGDRPNDPTNTEVRGGDVEFVIGTADGDDGVDRELPNDVDDHRVRSEGVYRFIAEIGDDDILTSPPPLALVLLTTAGNRAFGADVDGDEGGDGTGMGGNVQCKGKDVLLVPEVPVNTSDSICKICSFVKIGFPKANWFASSGVIESYR